MPRGEEAEGGCSIKVVSIGYSTVEAVPVYHCCAGGAAMRLLLAPRKRLPLRPCDYCGELGEWLESAEAVVGYEAGCAEVVRLARRWRVSLLMLDGINPLASPQAAALAEMARDAGFGLGVRWQGGPGRPDPGSFDVVVVDYVPGGYVEVEYNVDVLEFIEQTARADVDLEVNVYIREVRRTRKGVAMADLLPVVERIGDSDAALHVHVESHGGGGPVLDLYKKLRERVKFVYVHAGAYSEEDTHCPNCGATVVAREGGILLSAALRDGVCPNCGTPIPFRRPAAQRTPRLLAYETGGSTVWYHPEALPLRPRRSYSSAPT